MTPGAAPFIQGYWARVENHPMPTWHPGHRDKEWIREWQRGWDEADKHPNRGHKKL